MSLRLLLASLHLPAPPPSSVSRPRQHVALMPAFERGQGRGEGATCEGEEQARTRAGGLHRHEQDLEGDREVAEALGEHPHDGVAEPGDDGDARDLGVDGARLAALGLCCLRPRLTQSEDDVEEPAHAEEPPHPLHVAHRQRAEGAGRDHQDCRNNNTHHREGERGFGEKMRHTVSRRLRRGRRRLAIRGGLLHSLRAAGVPCVASAHTMPAAGRMQEAGCKQGKEGAGEAEQRPLTV
jgi:hypothetical protein